MTSKAGRTLGGFIVEREIGRGGMGEVLLAHHKGLARPAVLKRTLRGLADQPEALERFRREARAAGQVHHQNVVAVYDLFTHRGAHYLAQEYVDGVDLAGAISLEAPFPWRIAASIALEVARGLEAVHSEGTLHRDLKPANLLLGRGGEVKIGDFGLAIDAGASALTQPGVALGTPAYMAPEQLRCEGADARSDLYALGCVLYEMLTGRSPFPTPLPPESNGENSHTGGPTEPPARPRLRRVRRVTRGVPWRLARLVERCLRAKPRRRPESAQRVRRELEELLGSPSPADVQAELQAWLRSRALLEPRTDETAAHVDRGGAARSTSRLGPWTAAAALAVAAALFAFAQTGGLERGAEMTLATARGVAGASPAPLSHPTGPAVVRPPGR